MPHMSIGAFAKRSGLTPSALRFYDDVGLVRPARVDAGTGYRFYDVEQVARATSVRQLREIGMGLAQVRSVLDATPEDATRLVDEHVATVVDDVATVRRTAAAITSAFGRPPGRLVASLRGPVLADAVEQVLTATARDPALPILAGVRLEARDGVVTLTATDRHRLSTRTLVSAEDADDGWAGTLDGDRLRYVVPDVRRTAHVRVEASGDGVALRMADDVRRLDLVPDEFPDYRLMLDSLGPVTTRVVVAKADLVSTLELQDVGPVRMTVDQGVFAVADLRGADVPAVPGRVEGSDVRVAFDFVSLYPSISTATGPDVVLDLRGPAQPMTVRSADRGDLTTVVMPIDPAGITVDRREDPR